MLKLSKRQLFNCSEAAGVIERGNTAPAFDAGRPTYTRSSAHTPVSYTHLDVYKRQICVCALSLLNVSVVAASLSLLTDIL